MEFDTVIRGGTVVNVERIDRLDVGIAAGHIAALEVNLPPGRSEIDAHGMLVLPGGIDSHCHIEQISSFGVMCADDFYSASVSAAFGGTTTVIPFCAQHRSDHIPEVLADYHQRAAEKAVIDYGFHLIVANPDPQTLQTDLPAAIASGVRSFKVFMTYDRMRLHDEQILDVLATARAASRCLPKPARNTCSSRRRTSTAGLTVRCSAARRRRAMKPRSKPAGTDCATALWHCIPQIMPRTASMPAASCPRATRPHSRKWPMGFRAWSCVCHCLSPTGWAAAISASMSLSGCSAHGVADASYRVRVPTR